MNIEKKLEECKKAYEALCVVFPFRKSIKTVTDINGQQSIGYANINEDRIMAMEFVLRQQNTFTTRAFIAWDILREIFENENPVRN
jgi:hypothetical protein